MNIQRELLTVNPFSRPGKKLAGVKALVVHWVANPGTSAMANRNYFESLKKQSLDNADARYASAQFIVGLTGEIVQCIPSEEMAYHAGAKKYTPEAKGRLGPIPNTCTVGIELCHPKADGKFTEATLDAATELCALLCVQFGLNPLADIWTHHAVTEKPCPRWFVDHPEDFESFKQAVSGAVEKLRGKP
jgi:N-acetylmuramoyl-L-alanine amidase